MPARSPGVRWSCLLLALVVLLAAGCGGGEGDEDGDGGSADTPATADPSAVAKEPLTKAAGRLEAALPGRDCKVLIGLMLHSIQRESKPDAPPTAPECRYLKTEAKNELHDFRVTEAREFGPAGFSEGTGANARSGEVVGIVWLLDEDRSWKAAFEAIFRPQLGVAPHLPAEADANALRLVNAVKAADCKALWRVLGVSSRFVRNSEGRRERFCRTLPATYRDPNSAFAQIKADRAVLPVLLGRTRDFSFYGLQLKNGRYMDIVLSGPLSGSDPAELKEHVNPSVLEFLTVRQPR